MIAAAIAAPAAAASAKSALVAFDYAALNAITVSNLDGVSASKSATGPIGFHIQNTSGAIGSPISGSIRISPSQAAKADPALGVKTFTAQAPLTNVNLSGNQTGAPKDANIYTANFSYTKTVQSNEFVSFPMGFYYRGPSTSAPREFTVAVTLTLPGRAALTITSSVLLS
ncbi:hypothetical protein BJQ90_03338 [Arthrobacter sp. SO3]|nr:hypothetical protein [Arthrobacter sp. SO3]